MPYNPTIPPISLEDIQRWLADELNRINPDILVEQEYFSFTLRTVEPKKPQLAQIVFASGIIGGSPGSGWDPGAGQGMYEYTELGWAKLGGGDGNVIPTSHSALQDLLADDHPQYHNDARGDVRYYTKDIIDARALDNLSDVVTNNVEDKQVLTWDVGANSWVNADPTGGGGGSPPLPYADGQIDGGTGVAVYLVNQNIYVCGSVTTFSAGDLLDGGVA